MERTNKNWTHLHSQSADIAMGVDSSGNKDEGAGTKELCLVTLAKKLRI